MTMTWDQMEANADEHGFVPEKIYSQQCHLFPVCPPQDPEAAEIETAFWHAYLSRTRRFKKSPMYLDLFRYEWYEGRRRGGFWGYIEKTVQDIVCAPDPKIIILSAGCGRDLLKVGLAAGIWESTAPPKIQGTYREVDMKYFRLKKPGARILVTEFAGHNLALLQDTVKQMIARGLATEKMLAVRRWDFRKRTPLATASQEMVIFALTGNYCARSEQPYILREIARTIKPGGYLIASTISDRLDFHRAGTLLGKIRVLFDTPLAVPVLSDFWPWQARFARIASRMNNLGFWANVAAEEWMEFLEPAGMEQVRIYPGTSPFLPVEVLVARKKDNPE